MHTSPLDQPGTGDAGGLNVYVVEVAKQLADRGVEVEIFTRAVSPDSPPAVELVPGVLVRNVVAGPFEELDKNDLPGQICPFTTTCCTRTTGCPARSRRWPRNAGASR